MASSDVQRDRGCPRGVVLPSGPFGTSSTLKELARIVEFSGVKSLLLEEGTSAGLDPFVLLAAIGQTCAGLDLGVVLHSDNGRSPSIVAKLLSGLDAVTGGRAFVTFRADVSKGDVDRVEEALELISMMMDHDETDFHGRYFAVEHAWNLPRSSRTMTRPAKVSLLRGSGRTARSESGNGELFILTPYMPGVRGATGFDRPRSTELREGGSNDIDVRTLDLESATLESTLEQVRRTGGFVRLTSLPTREKLEGLLRSPE